VFPQGYATEHINPYTRTELRRQLEALGLVVLDLQYVGASEMIFKARKPVAAGQDSGRQSRRLRAVGS
jgi:hypothetical protein